MLSSVVAVITVPAPRTLASWIPVKPVATWPAVTTTVGFEVLEHPPPADTAAGLFVGNQANLSNDNEKGLSVIRLQVAKGYWRTHPARASHFRTVHQVANFAHRDDTSGIFVPMVPTEHPKPNTSTRAWSMDGRASPAVALSTRFFRKACTAQDLESDIRAPVARETDGYVEVGKTEEGLGMSFAIEGTDSSPIRKHDPSEAVRHTFLSIVWQAGTRPEAKK